MKIINLFVVSLLTSCTAYVPANYSVGYQYPVYSYPRYTYPNYNYGVYSYPSYPMYGYGHGHHWHH